MERILITGANRGIGYELVNQYLQFDAVQIFAACRTPSKASTLNALAAKHPEQLTIVQMDVDDEQSILTAAKTVAAQVDGLDLLINNAAINPPGEEQVLATITAEMMECVYRTNIIGQLLVVKAFADLLKAGNNPRIANISSGAGSLEEQENNAGMIAYCSSKAGLNMVTRKIAAELGDAGIITVTINPGWVKTDMGGSNADLEPSQSGSNLVKTFAALNAEHNGKFYNYDGASMPW
jgi:NAD(P)-dependent dehydrogenase (short-subunit alcohol dehydrogenase family)